VRANVRAGPASDTQVFIDGNQARLLVLCDSVGDTGIYTWRIFTVTTLYGNRTAFGMILGGLDTDHPHAAHGRRLLAQRRDELT